jgi:D-amino-acid dehydrogenase
MTQTTTIIGAGIVGLSTAIWLARNGERVKLIDRGKITDAASYGNGGILASCAIVPVTTPGLIAKAPKMLLSAKEPLFVNWSYMPRMMPWVIKYASNANTKDTSNTAEILSKLTNNSLQEHQSLAGDSEASHHIAPSDYLYIYDSKQDFHNDSFAWDLRAKHGITWEELENTALREYDEAFSGTQKFAIKMPNHGHIIDLAGYTQALLTYAKDLGVEYIEDNYKSASFKGGKLCSIKTDKQVIETDNLVIATGARSKSLLIDLGFKVPLETERGYHLDLINPNIKLKAPVMIAGGKFVINPMKDRLRLAGIVELGGLEAPTTAKAINLLCQSVKEAFPNLTWESEEEWLGHRPATTDSIPVIGELPNHPNVYCAFGHHHIGLTSGPKTGRLLAQLINKQPSEIDLSAFSINRF